jgi:hypothetical protein
MRVATDSECPIHGIEVLIRMLEENDRLDLLGEISGPADE